MLSTRVETQFGVFTAQGDEWGITHLYLPGQAVPTEGDGPLPWDFEAEVRDYLAGKRTDWNLPFTLTGTPFQLAVWYACKAIPYGQTSTYRELAQVAGYPGAARAVGQAMANNPLPLIIPCHRVLATGGGLGGYAGGLALKEALLRLEGAD